MRLIAVILIILKLNAGNAAVLTQVEGLDVVSTKLVVASTSNKMGMVVVFLSAHCPCSNSHMSELASLAHNYPDFQFIGVHSNTDEGREATVRYFSDNKLPFAVIQDNGAKIADMFKASKTPHAFIVSPAGALVFQGGVSSSHEFASAEKKYLRDALSDLVSGKKIKISQTRALGCSISRGGKNVW